MHHSILYRRRKVLIYPSTDWPKGLPFNSLFALAVNIGLDLLGDYVVESERNRTSERDHGGAVWARHLT